MAIIEGNTSTETVGQTSSPPTWSHTHNDYLKSLLLVFLTGNKIGGTVTYNGVAMTKIVEAGTGSQTAIYGMLNPPSGAHNIVVGSVTDQILLAWARSFGLVQQEGNLANFDSCSGNPTQNLVVAGVELNSLYYMCATQFRFNAVSIDVSPGTVLYNPSYEAGGSAHVESWFGKRSGISSWTTSITSPYTTQVSGCGVEILTGKKLLRAFIF